MGDGREKQTQSSTGIAPDIVAGTFSTKDVVGKRTLTGDPASPTGDQYIDHHALCTRAVREDCFLEAEQRTALIEDYKRLVSDAHGAYQRALLSIRIDELVKKDEDLPWFVSLVLDVASAEILGGLTKTLKRLKAEQLTELVEAAKLSSGDAVRHATAVASTAYIGLSMLSDERLSTLTKGAFDAGKKSVTGDVKGACGGVQREEKAAKLTYVDKLSAVATLAFEELATKPPGEATDAQLLVLWQSFKPPAHNQGVYKALLEEKIQRFMNSGVRDLGRRGVGLCTRDDSIACASAPAMQDTVVVRVKFKSGAPDRFAFARGDFFVDTSNTLPSERIPEQGLPLDQTKFHGSSIPNEARPHVQPSFERFIDPEFVDTAIARHLEVWGKAPETIEGDDSTWMWDKDRAQRAKENKSKEPGPFGIPKLQLPSKPQQDVFPNDLHSQERCE